MSTVYFYGVFEMRLETEKIRNIDSIGVRIPTEIKAKIKEAAKQNQQSMNAEIVHRLQESLEYDEAGELRKINEKLNEVLRRLDAI